VSYTFAVRAVNGSGNGTLSARSASINTPTTVPGAPTIGTATSGTSGGAITASINWTAPTDTGGTAITGYRVVGERITVSGSTTTVVSTTTIDVAASLRTYSMTFPSTGQVRFRVTTLNSVGAGAPSANSSGTIMAR